MNAERISKKMRDLKVLVVGDVCLDRWCYYDPDLSEPSRETGIPATRSRENRNHTRRRGDHRQQSRLTRSW